MDIYAETILDHYRNPHHYGRLEKPSLSVKDSNPLCGDSLQLDLLTDGKNKITDVGFIGNGCAISQAGASMLCDEIIGKSLKFAAKLNSEDILQMLGVPLTPVRTKCAFLAFFALKKAMLHMKT